MTSVPGSTTMRDTKLSAAVCHRSSRAAAPWRAWIAAPVLAAGLLGLLSLGCGSRSPKADELKNGQVLTSEDAGLPDAGLGDGNGGPVGGFDLGDPEGNGSQSCLPFTCEDVHAECGAVTDGCGGVLLCGTCGSGSVCSDRNHRCEAPAEVCS